MSELVHREQEHETNTTEVIQENTAPETEVFQSVEMIQEAVKEEIKQNLKVDQQEELKSASPHLHNLGNPQEQENPESQSPAKEQLSTEEHSAKIEEEIDLQKTTTIDSELKQSQEVTYTEEIKTVDTKVEEVVENTTSQKSEEVKIEDVSPKQKEQSTVIEEKKEEPSEGTAQEAENMFTVEKRLKIANEYKDQARDLIKLKRYPEALALYQQALTVTDPSYFRYINEQVKAEYTQLSTQLLNNMAICYFNLGSFEIAAQISDQTLLIDPKNLKAMYRKAVSYRNLGDYERAFDIIKTAVKSGGNENKEIYQEFETIKKLYKEYLEKNKEREKEVYGRMMNNSNKVTEEKKKEQQEELKQAQDLQNIINSSLFFGSTAFSFLIASKVFKVDVFSKTGFSLAGSLAASTYATYYFGNIWAKGFFGICAAALFGYMWKKQIAN